MISCLQFKPENVVNFYKKNDNQQLTKNNELQRNNVSSIYSKETSVAFGQAMKSICVDTDSDFIEDIRKAKQELIETGKVAYERNLTAGTGGNISCKCGNFILITGARTCLGNLKPEDITVLDLDGKVISGTLKPSSELLVHMAAYKQRDDIGAIIHSHSPYIQTYAIANQGIDENILPDITKNFGKVVCEEYHFPGSAELAEKTTRHLKDNNLVIMGNHGLLSVGKDLKQALKVADTAEHYAQVSYLVNNSGMNKVSFSPEQIQALRGKH